LTIKKGIFVAAAFCLLLCNGAFAAAPDIITTGELHAGMRGFGKTVVAGARIETFDVEVIGVMEKSGSTGGDLVLVRVSGDAMERSGGIAQGMSGSPVFFDGRLAGAVAFGWSLSDPTVVMLTPIGEMLKISDNMRKDLAARQKIKEEKARAQQEEDALHLEQLKKEAAARAEEEKKKAEVVKDLNRVSDHESILGDAGGEDKSAADGAGQTPEAPGGEGDVGLGETGEEKEPEPPSLAELLPKGTALMASGFSEQGLAILREGLKDYDIVPYNAGQSPPREFDAPLEPGSAVSVELIRGDVSLGVLGTVTWVDEDEVLAFGHPFTKLGKVNYFLSNAWTFTTVSSINSSFKVGAPGKLLGTVLQDRGSGVAGKLGLYPDVLPMLITVNDGKRGLNKTSAVQIAYNELFASYLTQAAVVSAVERMIDRKGEGTARVRFVIKSGDLPEGKQIVRENMFYSLTNISEALAGELVAGMNLLTRNRFKEVALTDASVYVDVQPGRNTATILSARPLVKKARPGDVVGIEVTLQPYRGENVKRIAHFVVPEEQADGEMPLSVRGGTSLAGLQAALNQQKSIEAALLLRYDSSKNKTFADEIDEFNKRDRNNDIVVDLLPGSKKNGKKNGKRKKNASHDFNADNLAEQEQQITEFVQGTKYKTNTASSYIITGETATALEIAKDPEQS
jgi:hypothetical protein